MSKGKKSSKKAKRRVVPLHELPPLPMGQTAREGTDLACALTCAAYIENATGSLLESALIADPLVSGPNGHLNDHKGMLAAAGPRADMCYCLGLIDKLTWKNAKQIAYIRNKFAHSHAPLSFASPEIMALCEDLRLWLFDETTGRPLADEKMNRILNAPRIHFVLTACAAFLQIMVAVYNDPVEDAEGNVTNRMRKRPSPRYGRFMPKTDGKLLFDTIVLFDD
jgi:hypothetical protein